MAETAAAKPRWTLGTRMAALIAGGYLAAALVAVLVAYTTGRSLGAILAGFPIPGIGLFVVLYFFHDRVPPPSAKDKLSSFHRAVWTRRMQVWEHAWFCSACRVAFWPAGALKAAYPASPAVPAHEFPLTVATMAERAYGPA
ncbi:hypothetical protein [Kitasatospora sp. NPDC059673]|uniref:hypothetical protein n=1 Tax=Kitasatospora sp. NPDC059673 TaxID=3346901 RepID=UPI0036A6CAE5